MRINCVFIRLTMRFDYNGKNPEKSLLIYNPCRYVFLVDTLSTLQTYRENGKTVPFIHNPKKPVGACV
jgi:hypothetical protein